jgi:hypothetical protein
MSGRGGIQAQAFGGLAEMPADDVLETLRLGRRGVIEKVDVVMTCRSSSWRSSPSSGFGVAVPMRPTGAGTISRSRPG